MQEVKLPSHSQALGDNFFSENSSARVPDCCFTIESEVFYMQAESALSRKLTEVQMKREILSKDFVA